MSMEFQKGAAVPAGRVVRKGRIKQALTRWCLHDLGEKWPMEKICRTAVEMGVPAIEVVPPEEFPLLRKFGLVSALTTSHMFVRGMNNPLHWDECLNKIGSSIDANAEAGFPNVVTFTGFSDTTVPEPGTRAGSMVSREEGIRNCVEGYKKIVGHAERKKVTICLEPLNTRDGADMKGHPGYQGDHLDFCLEVIDKVGSPALKLLFDIYHVQIMDGDLIRRIGTLKGKIGHVQVAGNPGRGEIGADQEINFPPLMRALLDIGYDGYVGLEFIPVRDTMQSLIEAVALLDV
ncbi:MAG: hyi 3 [Fibrobacteres bacterium]|nr:hyi 3 [Fibrobacterota bacterium]